MNFVDLNAIAAGTEGDLKAVTRVARNLVSWSQMEDFQSATELGGLVENLPDMTEIVHPRDFS